MPGPVSDPAGYSLPLGPLSPHPSARPRRVSSPCSPVPSTLSLEHRPDPQVIQVLRLTLRTPSRRAWLSQRAGACSQTATPPRSGPESRGLGLRTHRPPSAASDLSSGHTREMGPGAGRSNSRVWLQSKTRIHSLRPSLLIAKCAQGAVQRGSVFGAPTLRRREARCSPGLGRRSGLCGH